MLDAHAGSRWVTCYALALRGHVCQQAPTANAALAMLHGFDADVVILEWPRGGEGVGLVAKLRAFARARGRALRLIALSAIDEPASSGANEAAGEPADDRVDAYFVKPVDMNALERALQD